MTRKDFARTPSSRPIVNGRPTGDRLNKVGNRPLTTGHLYGSMAIADRECVSRPIRAFKPPIEQ